MKKSMKNVVWRLLRRNISAGQILGYALANLVGLSIVLTAIQFYNDVNTMWNSDDSFISRDFLVVSKKVNGVNMAGGDDPYSFTAAERDELQRQPWVRRVGEFTPAAFYVYASMDVPNMSRGISTSMFLESIPDEFFDVTPRGWDDYDPADPSAELPIILSKDYLALWNFGFATAQGLPQMSEKAWSLVPLKLILSGNGERRDIPAYIAGFSSRLNTIAVPERFMRWANSIFASAPLPPPSKLIVEVTRPGDPAIEKFLETHDYEVAGDKIDNGRTARFLTIITFVVIAVGGVISLLAFFILLLSIYLLLQKNREKIRDLILLGYTPRAVASRYCRIVVAVNVAVLVMAVAVALVGKSLWSASLGDLGVTGASVIPMIIIGIVIVGVITGLNILAIFRNVRRTVKS